MKNNKTACPQPIYFSLHHMHDPETLEYFIESPTNWPSSPSLESESESDEDSLKLFRKSESSFSRVFCCWGDAGVMISRGSCILSEANERCDG